MAKQKKQNKAEKRALEEARKFTLGKVLRLLLKSLVFAIIVSLLIALLSALGIPVLENTWVQLGIMLVVYFLAYPFLMSEFRPKKPKPQTKGKSK